MAVESGRGWRIAKEKASHKIDVVVALAQAALGAAKQAGRPPIVTIVSELWRLPPRKPVPLSRSPFSPEVRAELIEPGEV